MSVTEKDVKTLNPPQTETIALSGKAVVMYDKTSGSAIAFDGDSLKTALDNANSAYQLPSTGVPSSDLEEDVQTALEHAEDAYTEKADKVSGATEGHIATLDANGNLVDGGTSPVAMSLPGISEGIADSTSAGTAQEIVFRKSGGDGVNYVKRFKGKTLAWNQLINENNLSSNIGKTVNGITVSYNSSTKRFHVQGTATAAYDRSAVNSINIISGHKYLLYCPSFDSNDSVDIKTYLYFTGFTCYNRQIVTSAISSAAALWYVYIENGRTVGFDFYGSFVDLTLLYGTEIDCLTNAEILAKYEADFGTGYYEYNAGTLISNDTEKLETVGFNQYNPETGKANVIGGKEYYIGGTYTSISQDGETITPSSGIFTPTSTGEVVVVGGNATDTIINLSSSKNGTYEPYWKRTLNLGLNDFKVKDGDNIITVNGLKSAGPVYDEISNGKYIKRIGKVDLGTPTWDYDSSHRTMYASYPSDAKNATSYSTLANIICEKYETLTLASLYDGKIGIAFSGQANMRVVVYDSSYSDKDLFKAAMSGVMLYYELATPIEYELAEPMQNAILVDELGTEKAVFPTHEDGSPSAPLCTDSNYSISVAKLVSIVKSLSNESNG